MPSEPCGNTSLIVIARGTPADDARRSDDPFVRPFLFQCGGVDPPARPRFFSRDRQRDEDMPARLRYELRDLAAQAHNIRPFPLTISDVGEKAGARSATRRVGNAMARTCIHG